MLRVFELRDRSIMEANFERVNLWSIINLIVMVSVCLLQVRTYEQNLSVYLC